MVKMSTCFFSTDKMATSAPDARCESCQMPCVQQAAPLPALPVCLSRSGAHSPHIVTELQAVRTQLGAPDHPPTPKSNLHTVRKTHHASAGNLLRVVDDKAPKLHNGCSAHRMRSHSAWHCRIAREGTGASIFFLKPPLLKPTKGPKPCEAHNQYTK